MTTVYARLAPDRQSVLEVISDPRVTDIARLISIASPKAATYLPLVVDAAPTLLATERAIVGPYLIEAAQVRQTWQVVAKTQAEIDADTRLAESAQLQVIAAFLDSAAPATLVAAAADIQKLKRLCKWMMQQAVQRGVV